MIKTFKDEETEKVFFRQFSRKLPIDIQGVALSELRMLNNAYIMADLRIPLANHLEKLTGKKSGQHSIHGVARASPIVSNRSFGAKGLVI